MMDRHERVIARDLARMNRQKKEIEFQLKAYAKRGELDMVNDMATQFMVSKINIKKLSKLKSHTSNVKQKIQMMRSVNEINKALQTLTATMRTMNERVGASSLGSIIRDYDRELAKTETSVEMLDDAMSDEIDEDEQREIVSSVLEEIGVELGASMGSVPVSNNDSEVERILENRLKSLLI